MCRPDDSPPYDPPVDGQAVNALAWAMDTQESKPSWLMLDWAELVLLRLAVRGWTLVSMKESQRG